MVVNAVCGNGVAEAGETCATCPADLGSSCDGIGVPSDRNGGPSSGNPVNNPYIKQILVASLKALVSVLIPFVVLAFVITGFLFVSARGDVARLLVAKKFLLYSVVAAVITLGLWVIIEMVSSTLATVLL